MSGISQKVKEISVCFKWKNYQLYKMLGKFTSQTQHCTRHT